MWVPRSSLVAVNVGFGLYLYSNTVQLVKSGDNAMVEGQYATAGVQR